MITNIEIRARAMQEQAQESFARCLHANKKTYMQLGETGQPLDDTDRDLIRLAIYVALANLAMDDAEAAKNSEDNLM